MVEPITITPVEISGSSKKDNFIPIGTIVASILDFPTFCRVNGIDQDMSKSSWLPCDGRDVPGKSAYADAGGSKTPDLRGVFLRGVNTMYSNNLGAGVPETGQLNPKDIKAGVFQDDAFQGHQHNIPGSGGAAGKNGFWTGPDNDRIIYSHKSLVNDGTNGEPRTDNETRPNNISVYYYIKVR